VQSLFNLKMVKQFIYCVEEGSIFLRFLTFFEQRKRVNREDMADLSLWSHFVQRNEVCGL